VEKILALEGNGVIREYPGNYSVYLEYRAAEKQELAAAPARTLPKEQPKTTAIDPKKKPLSAWEQRSLAALATEIEKLEIAKVALEERLAAASYPDLVTLTAELETLSQKIDDTTDRWMALAEREG
jgi:ABC transport system ATP-binding/permease protein